MLKLFGRHSANNTSEASAAAPASTNTTSRSPESSESFLDGLRFLFDVRDGKPVKDNGSGVISDLSRGVQVITGDYKPNKD